MFLKWKFKKLVAIFLITEYDTVEESANSITTPIKVSVNKIRGPEELRKLMAKRKKANAGN